MTYNYSNVVSPAIKDTSQFSAPLLVVIQFRSIESDLNTKARVYYGWAGAKELCLPIICATTMIVNQIFFQKAFA